MTKAFNPDNNEEVVVSDSWKEFLTQGFKNGRDLPGYWIAGKTKDEIKNNIIKAISHSIDMLFEETDIQTKNIYFFKAPFGIYLKEVK